MNPPYGNHGHGIDEEFLYKSLQMAKKVITIQPLSWLIAIKQNKHIASIVDKHGIDIESTNAMNNFDAAIIGQNAIQYIDTETENKIIFNGDEFEKCSDIKFYSNDKALVKFSKCINYNNSVNDSLQDHLNETHKYYIEVPKLRGNKKANGYNSDFYTIISNNDKWLKENKIGKVNDNIGNIIFYSFDNKTELDNFINYIKTDFVRACLMLTKFNMNLLSGRMFRSIPWQDFADPVFSRSPKEIDDYLFAKYGVSEEVRQHISEILPDYYNIR